ncbi:MAG: NADH-quinone oxidoreductase subunit N, partial [Myxococcota bacterium]
TVVLLVSMGLSLALWFGGGPVDMPPIVSGYLATDKMGLLFDVLICGGGALSTLLAGGYLAEHDLERGEFYVLTLFSAFGAMVLARSVDLLSLFLGLETMSLGVYALVGFRRTSSRSVEGAVKYFLLGSFAAAILLFGGALLYGATGHTNFEEIGKVIAAGEAEVALVSVAILMLIAGLAFKVSAVPFHMWTPDAYEGAITPATSFMSVAVKSAAFAVLLRVLLVCFGDEVLRNAYTGWPPVIAAFAAVTMVYGNLAALGQQSVKRMLAYSSIAHAGYVLVGVCAASKGYVDTGRTLEVGSQSAHVLVNTGMSSVMYYLMAYTVSNVLVFGSLILVGSRGKEAVSYEDLAGVGRRHPMVAVPFVLGVLSLMGFPPTAGFVGKYYVFQAAVSAGGGMVWLAVIGVLSSAVGAYYYLRVLVFMFMKEPQTGAPVAIPMRSGSVVLALLVSGYFVLKMGITPASYLQFAIEAARQLVA